MGYTTEFEGAIKIEPPLTETQARAINDFCQARHGGPMQEFGYAPSFWCDWETDGETIYWNESEKSYHMDDWLRLLIQQFFAPWKRTLNGVLDAQGEASGDIWRLEVRDNQVVRKNGRLVFQED